PIGARTYAPRTYSRASVPSTKASLKLIRMTHKISFRPEAEADLFALYRYISDRSGPARAGDYIARIEAACMALATFPQRGTKRDDLAPGIRTIGFERRHDCVSGRGRHRADRPGILRGSRLRGVLSRLG